MPIVGSVVTGKQFFQNPTQATAKAFGKRLAWDAAGFLPGIGPMIQVGRYAKGLVDGAKRWWGSLPVRRSGGTLRRYQQGGAMPAEDMQQQIVALVQAAMAGDEQATQTIQQIMSAAEQGDPQSQQMAQMIEQVAQQMQGQAPAARYGAKLGYIRSLKPGRTNWLY